MYEFINAVFFATTSPQSSGNTGGVSLIDHQHGAIVAGHFGEFLKWREITVHGEYRVRDDQAAGRLRGLWFAENAPPARQQLAQVIDITVTINMHFRPAEPAAVDDAGMVQFVAIDRAPFAHESRDRADVGRVAAGKEQRRFSPFKLGQLLFELGM